jgi:hypothetical protein
LAIEVRRLRTIIKKFFQVAIDNLAPRRPSSSSKQMSLTGSNAPQAMSVNLMYRAGPEVQQTSTDRLSAALDRLEASAAKELPKAWLPGSSARGDKKARAPSAGRGSSHDHSILSTPGGCPQCVFLPIDGWADGWTGSA